MFLEKFFLFLKKNFVSLKKISFEILWSEVWKVGFQFILILGLPGMYFDAAVVFVASQTLLFRLALAILCDSYKMYSVTVSESEFFLIIGIWSLYKFYDGSKSFCLWIFFQNEYLMYVISWQDMAQILVRCNWIVLSTKGFPALETFESNHSIFVQFGPKTKSLT